ncbi:uncharacterized protein PgNI_03073 [Pyricularia grisea]|uniref:Uncharacterized protein n=1 Tax=Pyricularia grisea TaxID=148305 RepID=A0A6P8B8P1_PYRGI|nr:uncharacterized protein PgNI_03073 [Pyricularia grisea]TLD12210.1 hypothetical protein PgNI_03073 [Pyricularia grisea]
MRFLTAITIFAMAQVGLAYDYGTCIGMRMVGKRTVGHKAATVQLQLADAACKNSQDTAIAIGYPVQNS